MLLTNKLRWCLVAASAAVGSAIASEHLLAINSTSRAAATFSLLPSATSRGESSVFVLFHGLWGGPERFAWIPEYLTSAGNVLLVSSGANDNLTPQAAVKELDRLGMAGHDIFVVGFSKGTQIAVMFTDLLLERGIEPAGLVIMCGPGHPQYVLWPNRFTRISVSLLAPGPICQFVWGRVWYRKYRKALAVGDHEAAEYALRCQRTHCGTIISGARLLKRGVALSPGKYGRIKRAAIFAQAKDHLVGPCAEIWEAAMPGAAMHLVPTVGHGDFTGPGRMYYQAGLDALLAA